MTPARQGQQQPGNRETFVVLCESGFDNVARARSALMFASLAAAANYRTVLYCIQHGVDIMVRGEIEKRESRRAGVPSLSQRLGEALALGTEILCCSQTLENKRLREEDLVEGVRVAGAMTLINLATSARGVLCF